jgi:D-alanyl-D-alanine carboxypeptidase (penicillin-binding protein 5/6)
MCFKKVALVLCTLIYCFMPAGLFAAPNLGLQVKSAIMMNAGTGRILYVQNADQPIQPASLTKILSLYLVNEALRQGRAHLHDPVPISKKAQRAGGSRMFIESGTEVPLDCLIKGMAVVSANDASIAVAEYLGGSEETFVEKMNLKSSELGMQNSLFRNPNGLPAKGQTTTARDILKLSYEYIRRFPESLTIHAMPDYAYNNISQHNRNRFLKIYPDVDGLKTGFVCEAGYHIVVTAKKGNARLIAVVMGARTSAIRTKETKKLLEAGFKALSSDVNDLVIKSAPSSHRIKIRN